MKDYPEFKTALNESILSRIYWHLSSGLLLCVGIIFGGYVIFIVGYGMSYILYIIITILLHQV